jgi:hypothetical protein
MVLAYDKDLIVSIEYRTQTCGQPLCLVSAVVAK